MSSFPLHQVRAPTRPHPEVSNLPPFNETSYAAAKQVDTALDQARMPTVVPAAVFVNPAAVAAAAAADAATTLAAAGAATPEQSGAAGVGGEARAEEQGGGVLAGVGGDARSASLSPAAASTPAGGDGGDGLGKRKRISGVTGMDVAGGSGGTGGGSSAGGGMPGVAGATAAGGGAEAGDRDSKLIAQLLAEAGDPDADDVDYAEDAAIDDSMPDPAVDDEIDEEIFDDTLVDPPEIDPSGMRGALGRDEDVMGLNPSTGPLAGGDSVMLPSDTAVTGDYEVMRLGGEGARDKQLLSGSGAAAAAAAAAGVGAGGDMPVVKEGLPLAAAPMGMEEDREAV